MKKSYGSAVMMAALLVLIGAGSALALTVTANGKALVGTPVMEGGRALVPLREVAEALGLSVTYDAVSQAARIDRGGTDFHAWVKAGQSVAVARKGGEAEREVQMGAAVRMVGGSMYVPARFLGEAMGLKVSWNATAATVDISAGEAAPVTPTPPPTKPPAAGVDVSKLPPLKPELQAKMRLVIDTKAIDAKVYSQHARTLVPFRPVLTALGAQVWWEPERKYISATRKVGQVGLYLTLDKRVALVNQQPVAMDVAVQMIEGKVYVPLRFAAEALGAQVKWKADTQTIEVTSGAGTAPIPTATTGPTPGAVGGPTIGAGTPPGITIPTTGPTTPTGPTTVFPTTKVSDILANPAGYEGQFVSVEGTYVGRAEKYPVVPSDGIVNDGTGQVAFSGATARAFRAEEDRGKRVKVSGIVRISTDGVPYIEEGVTQPPSTEHSH